MMKILDHYFQFLNYFLNSKSSGASSSISKFSNPLETFSSSLYSFSSIRLFVFFFFIFQYYFLVLILLSEIVSELHFRIISLSSFNAFAPSIAVFDIVLLKLNEEGSIYLRKIRITSISILYSMNHINY